MTTLLEAFTAGAEGAYMAQESPDMIAARYARWQSAVHVSETPIGYDVIMDLTRRAVNLLRTEEKEAMRIFSILHAVESLYPEALALIHERYPPKT